MRSKGSIRGNGLGRKKNFMSISKAKAKEGLRILMNWSSNSNKLRSFVGVSLAFCIIVLLMLYEQTYGIISGHQLHGSCDCFDNVATHYIPGMGTPGNITTQIPSTRSNIGILYLPKPERSFHGNHWFHIGEHYISRRKIVQELLAVQVQRGGSIQHLKVVVEDPKLANMMTKMSFSLIVLTCLVAVEDQKLTRLLSIELFRESDVALRTADNSNRRTSVNSLSASQRAKIVMKTDPLFGYYKQDGANGVFEDYLSGGRHSSAGASVLKVSGSENTGFVQHWQHDQQFQHKHKRKCQRTASVTVAVENLYRHFTPPLQSSQEVTTTAGTRGTASVATQAGCEERPCSCGVYIGAVAHSPIPSFEWFHSSGEADALRSTTLSMCGIPETTLLANSDTSRKLTLLIYQRDLNRRFMHLEAIRTALKERKSSFGASTGNAKRQWDVQIFTHNENAAPCDIYKTLHSADVLLTAHGFQSTALMFMKKGAVLLEVFPYKYHRTTYYPLSQHFGLHYRSIQNTAPISSYSESSGLGGLVTSLASAGGAPSAQLLKVVSQGACMRDLKCRSYARSRDITMPTSHMDLVLQTMGDVERGRLDLFDGTADSK